MPPQQRTPRSAGLSLLALLAACSSGGEEQDCSVAGTCPNGRPTAAIAAPADGATVSEGASVTFTGSATDPDGDALSFRWHSSLNGQFGNTASLSFAGLSAGTHTIRFIATDSRGAADTASISLTVQPNQPPSATIDQPVDGGSADAGTSVTFSGSATDPEDGALVGASLVWTSSLDGQIGTGESFFRADLSAGTHTVTLTATDGGGSTGTDQISFTVNPGLAVTIEAPSETNGVPAAFQVGQTITFQGSADDPEDGPLSGGSLVWTSNVDGQIGTGTSFSRSDLSEGMHTVVLVATDSDGNSAEDTVLVNVNPPPDASSFNIWLRLAEGVTITPAQRTAVEDARARWEAILPANLPAIPFSRESFTCAGLTVPPFDETVDDVIIYIAFVPIDGPGGTVGQAGPCFLRDFDPAGSLEPGDLPFLGGMRFDEDDLEALEALNILDDVILHEMGHILGFGTVWNAMGLLQDPSTPTSCPDPMNPPPFADTHMDGTEAIAAMQALESTGGTYTGGARVPAENDVCEFGSGSLNGHWRESVFDEELMTPALELPTNPLSTLTIASMEDLGYPMVVPGEADPYNQTFSVVLDGDEPASILLENDVSGGPVWAVTPSGHVSRVR